MAETSAGALNLDDLGRFTRTVQAGEFVFREGDAGGTLFIVQDGRVELVAGEDGPSLAVIDVGGIFGEKAFFASGPRDLSARAMSDVRLIHLDRGALDRIAAEAPQIAVSMLAQLASRAGDQQTALREALARASVPTDIPVPAAAAVPPAERGDPTLVEADSGTAFPLAGLEEATVGRPDRSTGFVPEVDLTALDVKRTLSRHHAKLVRRDDRFFVREEAGTRNGTFVNGVRIATGTEVELHDGDQVQFGFVKTEFKWR
jgi:molybdopterin converting factor small subunit